MIVRPPAVVVEVDRQKMARETSTASPTSPSSPRVPGSRQITTLGASMSSSTSSVSDAARDKSSGMTSRAIRCRAPPRFRERLDASTCGVAVVPPRTRASRPPEMNDKARNGIRRADVQCALRFRDCAPHVDRSALASDASTRARGPRSTPGGLSSSHRCRSEMPPDCDSRDESRRKQLHRVEPVRRDFEKVSRARRRADRGTSRRQTHTVQLVASLARSGNDAPGRTLELLL